MSTLRSVLVLSGGLDSTVALYKLLAEDRGEVHALSFNYGQRHVRELVMASRLCGRLGVPHQTVYLPILQLFGNTALTVQPDMAQGQIDVPDGHYAEESMKATVVPNRNMVLISVAAAYCISKGFEQVVYAAHAGDHAVYPDCRENFVHLLDAALKVGNFHPVHLSAPFVNMTKEDIVRLGAQLLVPFKETWSCYRGGAYHCGTCGTCTERKEAFALAGIHDPTEYYPVAEKEKTGFSSRV